MPTRLTTPRVLGTLILALALTLTATLTGCSATGTASPTPSTSTQSVAEGCAAVGAAVSQAEEDLRTLDATDPAAAAAVMAESASSVGAAASTVKNSDLVATLPGIQSGFSKAATALQAIASGDLAQLSTLQQAATDLQTSFADLSRLCGVG